MTRGAVDDRVLTVFCRERLAGYKVPGAFHFVVEMPHNPNGKVLKTTLLKMWELSSNGP